MGEMRGIGLQPGDELGARGIVQLLFMFTDDPFPCHLPWRVVSIRMAHVSVDRSIGYQDADASHVERSFRPGSDLVEDAEFFKAAALERAPMPLGDPSAG